MKNEKNETAAAAVEGKKIVLEFNDSGGGSACFFCGEFVEYGGLDFFIEGTKEFRVCADCAKQKAPDLYLVWRDAHRWQQETDIKSYQQGVGAGKKDAAEMIFHAIDETPIERVRRICFKLGAFEESPF